MWAMLKESINEEWNIIEGRHVEKAAKLYISIQDTTMLTEPFQNQSVEDECFTATQTHQRFGSTVYWGWDRVFLR